MDLKISNSIQSFRQICIFVNHGILWKYFFSCTFKIIFQKPCFSSFSDSHYYKIATFDTNCLAKTNQVPLWSTKYLRFSPSCSACTRDFSSSYTCILWVSYLSKCGLRQWWPGPLNLEPYWTLEVSCSYFFFVIEKNCLSKNLTLHFSSFSLTICHHHHALLSLQFAHHSIHLLSLLSLHVFQDVITSSFASPTTHH